MICTYKTTAASFNHQLLSGSLQLFLITIMHSHQANIPLHLHPTCKVAAIDLGFNTVVFFSTEYQEENRAGGCMESVRKIDRQSACTITVKENQYYSIVSQT